MIHEVLAEPRRFTFMQTMRLLRHHLASLPGKNFQTVLEEDVRIHPQLSLAFPETDVAELEETAPDPNPRFRMVANFMGLYGASGPLPTWYTEDLIEEARNDESGSRDFLNTLNGPFYHLFFRAQCKYRPQMKMVEERDPVALEILFALLGLGSEQYRKGVQDDFRLLRYIGLFTQYPRSALGLKTLLADALDEPSVDMTLGKTGKARIPDDQRLRLGAPGSALGQNTYVGEEVDDRMGSFLLRIGPLDAKRFQEFLPGGDRHEGVSTLTRLYLMDPMNVELEVTLKTEELNTSRLGDPDWGRLGWSTWAFAGTPDDLDQPEPPRAYFRI